ncbi:MAG: hypothetical protein IJD70_03285 [Clostridia bacterium]|nr:hypothetical protein [Clostridia bacterium]
MKYKKWWMPAVFALISAIFVVIAICVNALITDDNSMTNHIYTMISMGIWFFIALPALSMIYTRKVLASERERILLSFYNSAMIILPMVFWLFVNIEVWMVLVLLYVWAEMWAFLGLAGKGEKKADVWYVPLFFGLAVIITAAYFSAFLSGHLHTAIISCIICPIAIAIYARVCVRDRSGKIIYTVYVSLAMLVSIFGNIVWPIIQGETQLENPTWDIVRLILSIVGTFVLYQFTALIGAGVKIKLPKKEKQAMKEETTEETTEESKEE